jgi:hypothetical protein
MRNTLTLSFPTDLLGRDLPDVLLLAQEAIALGFGNDDVPKAWKATYLTALDEAADRRDGTA